MKHFIITRFFSDPFGKTDEQMLSFLNEETLQNGFILLKNHFIKTLQNQLNKNFEIVILIYNELPLQSVSFLNEIECDYKIHIIHSKDLNKFIYNFYDNDFIITTRLDYDDFVHKNCVQDVQLAALDTNYLKLYGLNNGCTMDNNEIPYFFHPKYISIKHDFFSCFETLIVNTKNYKRPINIYHLGNHTKVCEYLIDNYKKFGLDDITQIQTQLDKDEKTKYIWYRHENAVSLIRNNAKHTTNVIINDVNFEDFGYISHKNR